jgi:hypothetical protein
MSRHLPDGQQTAGYFFLMYLAISIALAMPIPKSAMILGSGTGWVVDQAGDAITSPAVTGKMALAIFFIEFSTFCYSHIWKISNNQAR